MSNEPKWHKLPPVPGWYAVALLHGETRQVEGFGCSFYSDWKISGMWEEGNTRYYGPLPVEEVEHGEK